MMMMMCILNDYCTCMLCPINFCIAPADNCMMLLMMLVLTVFFLASVCCHSAADLC
jgi:hypothetical protein